MSIFQFGYTTHVFKESKLFVAYCAEFDVSSCGYTIEEAKKNLKDALVGFLESARERGVLQ